MNVRRLIEYDALIGLNLELILKSLSKISNSLVKNDAYTYLFFRVGEFDYGVGIS